MGQPQNGGRGCPVCFKRGSLCRCDRGRVVQVQVSRKVVRPRMLPPRIPDELVALERARTLLGNRVMYELTDKRRKELEALVGCYPSVKEAALWKSALKGLREEMLELEPEPEP